MRKHLVIGGPGAGKTTRLLEIMIEFLHRGIKPERIAFVSFTRKAAQEARDRTKGKKLPYFKTLHSLATKELNIQRNGLLTREHYAELSKLLGMNLAGQIDEEFNYLDKGDRYLFLTGYAKTKKILLWKAFCERGEDLDFPTLELVDSTIQKYKDDIGIVDFNDVLSNYITKCPPLDIDLAIIDEAQDLSPLQWEMVNHMTSRCPHIYYAGDDDQAIYSWAGADVNHFLTLKVDEKETLPRSYRLPKPIFMAAQNIVSYIHKRYEKDWTHSDHEGAVIEFNHFDELDFTQGDWLILARNYKTTAGIREYLDRAEIDYSSKYKEGSARIHVNTIHSQKGGEADNVVLFKDMGPLSYENLMAGGQREDDEHRVFYVGATRARKNLYLKESTTQRSYY